MPGLVVFKRRWTAGSDDLVLPGALLFLLHFILFIVTVVYLSSYSDLDKWSARDPEDLKDRNANETTIIHVKCAKSVKSYSFVFVALLVAGMALEAMLVGFSMQGTIFNAKPRQPVALIIYARSTLGIIEVLFSVAAASYLSLNWVQCQQLYHLFLVQAAIVAINFTLLFIVMLVACCAYDSTGYSFYKMKKASERRSLVSTTHMDALRTEFEATLQKSWHASLRRCCCCVRDSQNTQVALEEVSHLLRDFFRDLDVIPSDLLAGLILLRHKQQCMESSKVLSGSEVDDYLCGRPISNNTVYHDPSSANNKQRYEDMIYFCNYAIASYGPLFYLLYNPGTGLCKLVNQCVCMSCGGGEERRRFSTATIENDGCCCECQTSAVLRSLKGNVNDSELIIASWNNDLYKQPFFVCVDHDKKAVVVTIRGTLSELDALTDVVATPVCISCDGVDSTWKCHKGIMKAAMYLKEKLVDEMVLSQAFGRDLSRGTRDYNLVLVGHSLGAGVASILAIMLRPLYPDLVCYAYSPPGGLLSLSAMEGSKDYINTAVFGKDMIIRMGLPQLGRMKNDIIDLLKRTNLPKYQIIFGNMFKATEDRHCLFTDDPQEGSDVEQSLINNFGRCGDVVEHEALYPPGRILHIIYKRPESTGSCFSNQAAFHHHHPSSLVGNKPKMDDDDDEMPLDLVFKNTFVPQERHFPYVTNRSSEGTSYFAVEADNKNDFNEILVSHNMVKHHWPQELQKAMKKAMLTSLSPELEKKYSKSATIPCHTRLSRHEEGETGLAPEEQPILQPDIVQVSLRQNHDAQQEADPSPRSDGKEGAPPACIDQRYEASIAHSSDRPPPMPSAQTTSVVQSVDTIVEVNDLSPFNRNENNNKNGPASSETKDDNEAITPEESCNVERHRLTVAVTTGDDIRHKHIDDGGVTAPSPSAATPTNEDIQSKPSAKQFSDYIDTVLREPRDNCSATNRLSLVPSSRYSRSQSMPTRNSISSPSDLDKEVLERARFEPNLIPKPPRSNSTSSRKRPANLPVRKPRDHASAPPSRTTTPTTVRKPPSSMCD